MTEHTFEISKEFVQKHKDKITEDYLLYSAKSVIANETNIDGDSINKIVIPNSTVSGKDDITDILILNYDNEDDIDIINKQKKN